MVVEGEGTPDPAVDVRPKRGRADADAGANADADAGAAQDGSSPVLALLRSFKTDPGKRAAVLLANAGGVAFGFYYYLPQFDVTAPGLWPLVPDSPFAVLVASLALLLWVVGRPNRYVDALAFVTMVKVGLWTAFILWLHPAHFDFALVGTSTNTVLFYLHLGMAAQGLVFLPDLRPLGWPGWSGLLAWFTFNDAMDYLWPEVTSPIRTCPGLYPWTVPCENAALVGAVTVALSVGLTAVAWVWVRRRRRQGPGASTADRPGGSG